MNKYGPFKVYTPIPGTPAGKMAKCIKAQFICTAGKQDWYELQKTFARNTLKVVYAENGVVIQASYDVSTLWPVNASVVEIPTEQIPKAFTLPLRGTNWQYNGQRLVPRVYSAEEQRILAERQKKLLMEEAETILSPLERAVRLGMATEDEVKRLNAWEIYSVKLSRVDTNKAEWPAKPE